MTYTTKSHTPDNNRFRMILPMSYRLELDKEDYKEFMSNLLEWLPFPVDPGVKQRSKKWESFDKGTYHYNLTTEDNYNFIDVLPFVPKTSRNEKHQEHMTNLKSLDNLERWFAQRFTDGERNNQMIRYALALVSAGYTYREIEDRVIAFNSKLSNGLKKEELQSTVLVTVARKLQGTASQP